MGAAAALSPVYSSPSARCPAPCRLPAAGHGQQARERLRVRL